MSNAAFWFIIGTQILTMVGWGLAISIIRNLIKISRANTQAILLLLQITALMVRPSDHHHG